MTYRPRHKVILAHQTIGNPIPNIITNHPPTNKHTHTHLSPLKTTPTLPDPLATKATITTYKKLNVKKPKNLQLHGYQPMNILVHQKHKLHHKNHPYSKLNSHIKHKLHLKNKLTIGSMATDLAYQWRHPTNNKKHIQNKQYNYIPHPILERHHKPNSQLKSNSHTKYKHDPKNTTASAY